MGLSGIVVSQEKIAIVTLTYKPSVSIFFCLFARISFFLFVCVQWKDLLLSIGLGLQSTDVKWSVWSWYNDGDFSFRLFFPQKGKIGIVCHMSFCALDCFYRGCPSYTKQRKSIRNYKGRCTEKARKETSSFKYLYLRLYGVQSLMA